MAKAKDLLAPLPIASRKRRQPKVVAVRELGGNLRLRQLEPEQTVAMRHQFARVGIDKVSQVSADTCKELSVKLLRISLAKASGPGLAFPSGSDQALYSLPAERLTALARESAEWSEVFADEFAGEDEGEAEDVG